MSCSEVSGFDVDACNGKGCPLAALCRRKAAKEKSKGLVWIMPEQFDKKTGKCKHFIKASG